jgi:hypothetical protein
MVTASTKRDESGARLALARFQTLELIQGIKPVWLRMPAASRISGLSRTFLFEQIVLGTIVSKHIKKPGKTKGVRLINYDSLIAFIEGMEG